MIDFLQLTHVINVHPNFKSRCLESISDFQHYWFGAPVVTYHDVTFLFWLTFSLCAMPCKQSRLIHSRLRLSFYQFKFFKILS